MRELRKSLENAIITVLSFDRQIIYLVSLIATLGSLTVSILYGWDTFTLSVAQRILMYPIVLISGLSILLDREDFIKYVLILSSLGMIVSAYHHLTVRLNTLVGCGFALPCNTGSRIIVQGMNLRPMYLPLMAFFAFTAITLVSLPKISEINNIKHKVNLWN